MTESTDLSPYLERCLPCPFCGSQPFTIQADQNQGEKWGSVHCCVVGPEVRTSYEPVDKWADQAVAEWNKRA